MQHPLVKIHTTKGIITVELYPEYAPNTVNSFIFAIRQNMYENRLIKRIVPEYVLQPSYSYFDDDDCNYMLEGEFAANGIENPMKMEKWTVAMAGDGTKEAHGCEFFITLSDEAGEKLQGRFAAFGKVVDGFEVVDSLVNVELQRVYPEGMNATVYQPITDEYMEHVEVDTLGVEYPKPKIKYWIRWGC